MATLVLLSWLANNKVVANKTLVARQLVFVAEKLLAGAVQTEVNEVPPAPCVIPAGPSSGYNWRLTREQSGAVRSR